MTVFNLEFSRYLTTVAFSYNINIQFNVSFIKWVKTKHPFFSNTQGGPSFPYFPENFRGIKCSWLSQGKYLLDRTQYQDIFSTKEFFVSYDWTFESFVDL